MVNLQYWYESLLQNQHPPYQAYQELQMTENQGRPDQGLKYERELINDVIALKMLTLDRTKP